VTPCPFCASTDVRMQYEGPGMYRVGCRRSGCFADGPLAGTPERAEELWDKNATDKGLKLTLTMAYNDLDGAEQYFSERADAEAVGTPLQFKGNEEMSLMMDVRGAREAINRILSRMPADPPPVGKVVKGDA
jgi:hypothetical protein